jgi:16S rRNA (cytidine1402-2'-O)-methyltransferase
MGTLFVVGTPIGNLEDMTARAARVLGQVQLVAAEDTRVTRRLLAHLGIRVPLVSYHEHNQRARIPRLLEALESGDVALVSDAGMPAVSDPGSELVSRAAAAGFPVESVPGVSALTTALAASGLPADAFLFLGFLPRRSKGRRRCLRAASSLPLTLVAFEAPHRLRATLRDMLEELGDREVAVCRELTKLHEEVFRGSLSQALDHFQAPLGELVLVVQGAPEEASPAGPPPSQLEEARQQLSRLRKARTRAKEAVAQVADSLDLPKNTVYRLWLETARRSRG